MRSRIDAWLHGATEVLIRDVASARHLIEARADRPVRFAPMIADSFRDPAVRVDFQRNPGTADVESFDLHDVVLAAERLILFHDGGRIKETRYIVDDHDYWREPSAPRDVHETDDGRTVVIGCNLAFRNYYHWLMQCLPAIDHSIRTVGASNCILALPRLAGWQEESLATLGYAGIPRIEIDFDCHYHFQRAHYCTYLNGTAEDFLSPRCLNVLDRLAAQIAPVPDAPERLYVARLDTTNRVIRNENEVRQLLEKLGFTTIVPGYFSFDTQIGLFKSVRLVVGAHGAGMTNVAFCEPGTIVLELIQSTYPILLMNRIAQAGGLRYHAECFECETGNDVHRQDWLIDIKQLETKLRTLL
jgi:capsular polysaccharide biosynthesis protein